MACVCGEATCGSRLNTSGVFAFPRLRTSRRVKQRHWQRRFTGEMSQRRRRLPWTCTAFLACRLKPMMDIDQRFRDAVQRLWAARDEQQKKQAERGTIDAGTRGAVTGGTQMGAL